MNIVEHQKLADELHVKVEKLTNEKLVNLANALSEAHIGNTKSLFEKPFWHTLDRLPLQFLDVETLKHELTVRHAAFCKLPNYLADSQVKVQTNEILDRWSKAGLIKINSDSNRQIPKMELTKFGSDALHLSHPRKSSWLLLWEEFVKNRIAYSFGVIGGVVTIFELFSWLKWLMS